MLRFIAQHRRCFGISLDKGLMIFLCLVSTRTLSHSFCSAFIVPQRPFSTSTFSSSKHNIESKASDSILDRSQLEKLTVKELKNKIKELDTNVKISQLKLKSDIIDFLIHQYNDTDTDKETRSPIDMIENDTVNVKQKKKNSRSMPPLDSPPDHVNESKTSTNNPLSPKDMIFQKVYNRYPPLKDLQLAIDGHDDVDEDALSIHMHPNFYKSFTGLGDNDIRQKYHPIMQGLTSSDLDIVTVGTASCVPGVTRGVSCTALRLQWRRRGEDVQSNKEPVTGGIWIFDCGESTQVSLYIRRSIIMIIFGNEETLMLAPDRELRLHGDAHLAPVQRRSGLNQHG